VGHFGGGRFAGAHGRHGYGGWGYGDSCWSYYGMVPHRHHLCY
jgi:hypothetical protein